MQPKYFIKYILFSLIIIFNCHYINASNKNTKQNKYYQIELIIFKNKISNESPELGIKKTNLFSIPDDGINFDTLKHENELGESDQPIAIESNLLTHHNIYKKIQNNPNYTTIAHIGWLQTKKDINKSKPIYFNMADSTNPTGSIAGVIKLNVQKYLHAKVNLLYKTELQDFIINETPRLKNKELIYLDNPEFGAILTAIDK